MRISSLIIVVFVYLMSGISFADELVNQEVNLLQSIADESEKGAEGRVIVGNDPDWLFLRSELSHVAKGRFWEKNWKDVSVAGEDPLPIFLALNEKLKSLGVQFVYVPVPPKVSIYPDKFTKKISTKDEIIRAIPFLDKLRMGGIKVIDIEPLLMKERRSNGSQSYCMTDSHPSPWTCELIAERVAKEIRGYEWALDSSKKSCSALRRCKIIFVPRSTPSAGTIENLPLPFDSHFHPSFSPARFVRTSTLDATINAE